MPYTLIRDPNFTGIVPGNPTSLEAIYDAVAPESDPLEAVFGEIFIAYVVLIPAPGVIVSGAPMKVPSGGVLVDAYVGIIFNSSPDLVSFDASNAFAGISVTVPDAQHTNLGQLRIITGYPDGGRLFSTNDIVNSTIPSSSALFTTSADVVNFNNLQPDQITAVNAAPTQLYDGLGGNDDVTLPNKGANNDYKLTDKVSWNPTSTFVENLTAGQHATIKAGDGNYKIAITGGNFSTIVGGPGSMDVSFNGTGTTSFEGNLKGSAKVSGGGSLWVTGTLTGTATIDQNSTLEIAGTPAPAPNSDIALVTFGLGNANKLQIDSPKTSDMVSIQGFATGDEIDFANQTNLTLESATGTNTNAVHIYNKSTLVDTLFFGGGAQTTSLEPVSDNNGGTKIIVDPTSVSLIDPQPPGEAIGVSLNFIHWDIIHKNEGGGWLNPYVPINPANPSGHSGLTIGYGVDLANGITQAQFENIFFKEWATNPNLKYLHDGMAEKGLDAFRYLQKGKEAFITYNGVSAHASVSVSITESQANALTNWSESEHLTTLLKQWNGATTIAFTDLPWQAQTALMDITFNYGTVNPKNSSLLKDAALAAAGMNSLGHGIEWAKVADDIALLSSNHERMLLDSSLVRELVPAGSTLPGLPVSEPATSVAANTSTYSFSVADAVTRYAFDPSGSTTYALIANSGSPNISSIQLPSDSADSYLVSYQIGTSWSATQEAQPDQIINLPANVTGLQVQLLDAGGNPVPDTDFIFFVTFAKAGDFSGNVYNLTGAPSVTITTSNSNLNVANDSATITFAFSDAVTDFSLADVTANGGILSNLSGSGTTYTATFTGSPDLNINNASVSVMLGSYHDSSGNAGSGSSSANFALDTVTSTAQTVDSAGGAVSTDANGNGRLLVTKVSATTDNNATVINAGHVVTITVTMNEPVTVTGHPTLQLNDNALATYVSGSGSETLTFVYTVKAGDNVSDLQVTGLLTPAGADIQDSAGRSLFGGVTGDLGLQIDTMPPTVAAISASTNDHATVVNTGHLLTVNVSTSEAVTVLGHPALQLNDNEVAVYAGGSGSHTLSFTYTVQPGDHVSDLQVTGLLLPSGASVQDAAGNNLFGGVTGDLGIAINSLTGNDIQSEFFAITRSSLPLDQAIIVSNSISSGAQTEFQYVKGLLSNVAATTMAAVAVEGSMYGAVGSSAEVTLLASEFLPAQVTNAIKNGYNPQVYATEALGLALSFGDENGGTAFAKSYGPSSAGMPNSASGDSAFAAAAATAIFGSASTANIVGVIETWVTNWKTFYTSNGIPGISNASAPQIDLAARGAAWGDAVGVALANDLGPLKGQSANFLMDAAQGIASYSMSLVGQPAHHLFQGELIT